MPSLGGLLIHCTYTLVVDDLDDGGEATGIRALLEEDNAADLDILPVGSTDFRSHREEVSDYRWGDVIVS